MSTPDLIALADSLAAKLRRTGHQATTEEDLRIATELALRPILGQLELTLTPHGEAATSSGDCDDERLDDLVRRLVANG